MIKLKSLVIKGHYPVVVGIITMDGRIVSKETTKTHGDLNYTRGTCWRYNLHTKTVYWHGDESEHDEVDEINVDNHLQKTYGYKVKRNITTGGMDALDNMDSYQRHDADAHGIYEGVFPKEHYEMEEKIQQFRDKLALKYHPKLQNLEFYLHADDTLHIGLLKVKLEYRHQGVGSSIMKDIMDFAKKNKLVITLHREPERGYTKKLEKFYKKHGFVDNRGRNRNYKYSSLFGSTMYKKPNMNESFNLTSDIEHECLAMAKFIGSLFITDFKLRDKRAKNQLDSQIVKYSQYFRLALKYKSEGEILFNIKPSKETTDWGKADYEISSKKGIIPIVVVKIYDGIYPEPLGYVNSIDEIDKIYIVAAKDEFISIFPSAIEELTETIKHEVRHCIQFTHDIGLPKEKILNRNTDVLGYYLKPLPGPDDAKTRHHMRDIEFKTNVHSYAFYIKRYLNKNYQRSKWESNFKAMIRGDSMIVNDNNVHGIIKNLKNMRKNDRTRWKQFVKEVYKLIFIDKEYD